MNTMCMPSSSLSRMMNLYLQQEVNGVYGPMTDQITFLEYLIPPADYTSGVYNTGKVDLRNFSSSLLILNVGALSGGDTVGITVGQSADGVSGWTYASGSHVPIITEANTISTLEVKLSFLDPGNFFVRYTIGRDAGDCILTAFTIALGAVNPPESANDCAAVLQRILYQ